MAIVFLKFGKIMGPYFFGLKNRMAASFLERKARAFLLYGKADPIHGKSICRLDEM